MELHAFNLELAVTQAHDDTVFCLRADLEGLRQGFSLNNQRMVTGCGEGIRDGPEDAFSVVLDFTGFSMKQFRRSDNFRAESRPDCLVPEAYSKNRVSAS